MFYEEMPWSWRNTRNVWASIAVSLLSWRLAFCTSSENSNWSAQLRIGPISFRFGASIGNVSSDNWLEAKIGLSEKEAAERTARRLHWKGELE